MSQPLGHDREDSCQFQTALDGSMQHDCDRVRGEILDGHEGLTRYMSYSYLEGNGIYPLLGGRRGG
jgi:hypothetical protein